MDGSVLIAGRAGRDRGGRFVAGVSGNPAGKRKGTLNRMTRLKLLLEADESGAVARVVIDRALAGDMVAARFCLGLIMPKPRSRPVELDLPDCRDIDGIVAGFGVTVAAMAAGEITPDEALTVTKVPRPPFPTFGSACIRPALRGRPALAPAVPIALVPAMLPAHPETTSRP